jgi:RNA polymerase-binding transcription factor DksA
VTRGTGPATPRERERDGESPGARERLAAELEPVLAARRAELLGLKERLAADLEALREEFEPELVERGQEETIARTLTTLDDRERDELAAIERALSRVAAGKYGTCVRCARRIAAQRLRALPWAETCVACAAACEERPR